MKRIAHGLLIIVFATAAAFAVMPSAAAQDVNPAAGPASLETAPVMVDGSVLFRLRGISAFTAEDRARDIAQRIKDAARNPAVTHETIVVKTLADWSEIRAADKMVVSIFDLDAELEGVDRSLFAEAVLHQVRDAVDRYRRDRSPASLATFAAYGLTATVAFALGLVLLLAFMRSFNRFAAARHEKYIAPLEAKSSRILRADQIWRLLHAVLKGFWILAGAILFYAYLNFLLSLFPWTRAFSNRLSDLVGDRVLTVGVAILDAIPDLILLLILILITRYLLRLTRLFFDAIRDGHLTVGRFLPEWADPTYRIARLVIVAFAFVIAYPYLPGSGTVAFHGVSIFLGVLLSLGSSSFISNVIAGHTLTYRRAFRVGDVVKIQDTVGEVIETGLLVTRLRTKRNEIVVVPNSLILANQILNYSELAREVGVVLHTTVGIGYEVPWRQTEEILLLAAQRTAGIASEPAPFAHQAELGDFCVTYELNVYCRDARAMMSIRSDLHRNILDLFNEYGIQIMTPAYEGDPETAKIVPRDQWFAAPARPDGAGATPGSGSQETGVGVR